MMRSMLTTTRQYAFSKAAMSTAVTLTSVRGREIIDSRGNPTVEVDVHTTIGKHLAYIQAYIYIDAYHYHYLSHNTSMHMHTYH